MKFLYSEGPIIACSTGNIAHAAMAVLRISGFKSVTDFQPFFPLNLQEIEPRRVYYTRLVSDGELLDDICLTFFQGPKSYNGENILELSVHGNILNIERILHLFVAKGECRLATPGEFTYRALKNRKLTLSQVEGLDLFLNANTGYALDQGLSLLNGSLHDIYLELYALFLKHKSSLELSIDFSEDVGEEQARSHFFESLKLFQNKFETLYRRVLPLDHNLIRPEIVLAGLPNSGKSSLFNLLLAEERAIVSGTAGTTRDYITETISIEGVKYRLIDTAGVREAHDFVEAEGVKRTKSILQKSFFSVLLINPLEMMEGFEELAKHSFDAIYFTHADLPGFEESKKNLVARYPQLGSIGALNLLEHSRDWEKELLKSINKKYLDQTRAKPILLDRHKSLILDCHKKLDHYAKIAAYESDVAILSSELNTLGHCLSELIGIISPDQILNSIFSNFCIGK